jgi:hypothetical protein
VAFFRKIKAGLVKNDIESFIGEEGNLFFNIETGELRLSDGSTPGGNPIGGNSVTTISNIEPVEPTNGTIWYNPDNNELSIYYDDGASPDWFSVAGGDGTGPRGFTGSQGSLGYTGSAGTNGFTGSQGNSGYTGSASTIPGYTGSAGTNGFTGSAGTNGFTGSAGTNGFTGSAGTNGYTGSAGTNGFTGSAGTNGFTGSAGTNGFTGSAGTNGYTGSAGTNGFTGSAGTNGFTGSQGDIGYTGSQGNIGYTGSAGIVDGMSSNGIDTITVDAGYSIIPATDGLQNLGSPTNRFGTIYVGSNSIDIGGTVLSIDPIDGALKVTLPSGNLQYIKAEGLVFPNGTIQTTKAPRMYTNTDAAAGLTIEDLIPGDFYYDDGTESIFIMVDTGLGYNSLLDLTVRAQG